MIDITKLTQEELWGLMYVTQQRNLEIKSKNDTLPEGAPTEPYITVTQYITEVLKSTFQSYYKLCVDAKVQNTIQGFMSLPPEQQAEKVQQLNIKDIIDPALAPLE